MNKKNKQSMSLKVILRLTINNCSMHECQINLKYSALHFYMVHWKKKYNQHVLVEVKKTKNFS